jgi:hypothetical protein
MSLFKNLIKTFFGKTPKKQTNQNDLNYKWEIQKESSKTSEEIDPFLFHTKKIRKAYTFKKPTKLHLIRLHLLNKESIDSWTAIEKYGATRLSAIIFKLRSRGMDITSIPCSALDRNLNVCNYTTYKLNK